LEKRLKAFNNTTWGSAPSQKDSPRPQAGCKSATDGTTSLKIKNPKFKISPPPNNVLHMMQNELRIFNSVLIIYRTYTYPLTQPRDL